MTPGGGSSSLMIVATASLRLTTILCSQPAKRAIRLLFFPRPKRSKSGTNQKSRINDAGKDNKKGRHPQWVPALEM